MLSSALRKNPILLASVFAFVAVVRAAGAAETKPTFTFQCQRQPGQTDHVTALLEVGGETKYLDDKKPHRQKMSVTCSLDYCEKTLEVPAATDAPARSVRDYQKVAAVVKVGEGQVEPVLRPNTG